MAESVEGEEQVQMPHSSPSSGSTLGTCVEIKMPKRTNTFQRLVVWLQESLAGLDARVTESAMIMDHSCGEELEVDILVEFHKAGVRYRTVLECRDHSRNAGRDWIRDLKTKRDSCRLDKIIAVHSKGFSSSAGRAAQEHNIPLYTLKNIPLDKADKSIAMQFLGTPLFSRSILSVGVVFEDLPEGVKGSVDLSRVYLSDRITTKPVGELATELVALDPPPDPQIPEGHYADADRRFGVERGRYFVKHGADFYEVRGLDIALRVFKSISVCGPTPRQLETSEDDGVIGAIAAQTLPGPGGVYTLGVAVDCSTGKPQLFLELPPGINPLDFRMELNVQYTEQGSDDLKTKTIPSELVVLDEQGKNLPLWEFRYVIKSIDHEAPPESIEEESILGFYFADRKQKRDIHQLIVEAIRQSGLPVEGLLPGQKKRGTARVEIKDPQKNSPLYMQVRDGDGTCFVEVNFILIDIEHWLKEPEDASKESKP